MTGIKGRRAKHAATTLFTVTSLQEHAVSLQPRQQVEHIQQHVWGCEGMLGLLPGVTCVAGCSREEEEKLEGCRRKDTGRQSVGLACTMHKALTGWRE